MNDPDVGDSRVVMNRCMSLDGFVAGPGDAMDWIMEFLGPGDFPEVMAATGAMLIGRRTYEVGRRMTGDSYDGGARFVMTHEPPDTPDPRVTFLTGDLEEAVAKALRAADGRNVEILGTDLAGQCLRRGLVDEILVYVLPVLLGDGTRLFSSPGLGRIDLAPLSTSRSGAVTVLRFRVVT
ncbi:dihydrofolate reductase family protein [Streptomyces sp. NBC_01216]|uniref:dihydrofolate reductase family protein n=1 Tax=unclassified Streptomyces TaxID=2593676 RepID=UPI002E143383|nr:dihydrofolate reductase family protein [Streptomyces sp. NBC_01216]